MKISVCYIAKNEEKNLPLSLETVQPFADELIVADTGSTDHTRQIAAAAGALVGLLPLRRPARARGLRREKARLRALLRAAPLPALFGLNIKELL